MPILAGQTVTAGQLNRMQPVPYEAIASSATAVLATTTIVDVPGATVTLTTTTPNAIYRVTGIFDVLPGATSASVLVFGFLNVNGTTDTGVAIQGLTSSMRATVSQTWRGTLAAAGSHTLKLQASLSGALGSGATIRPQNSKISIEILEVV
ncbi:hypothetical protein ACIQRW_15130 [Streptomyces sp. NPDC091287]|uniref:hypothetical protein n=1 Tax=Streptomyces sp. NPDC091287 TaxID=3365988 RepID=UPI00381B0A8A